MTMATPAEDALPVSVAFVPPDAKIAAQAAQCDTMCLTAGVQLGEAVPGLYDLSSRFASLADMLIREGGSKPAESLDSVAQDLAIVGSALTTERESVAELIKLNNALARRIADLEDHVRFLSSMVSNVKIEVATIDENEHRLEGFADNLKQLATKSEATVADFQSTHQTLVRQLHRTAAAQSAFVSSHGQKFTAAADEITASLGAVNARRKTVGVIAEDIGDITRQIGAQIAECVMALQVGDSVRQRLEHAAEAISIATDLSGNTGLSGFSDDFVVARFDREAAAARIFTMAGVQIDEAAKEFTKDVFTVVSLLTRIADATTSLNRRGYDLTSSPSDGSRSFLEDLETKLAAATLLIEQCGRSRQLVDDTAAQVIASVGDLKSLANKVAAMATDMMIVGTNAVVTSYRLGSKGIPLSVIAQHLRSHAIHVTDAARLVGPALETVLTSARQFTLSREGRDASSMGSMGLRITEALAAFRMGDSAVEEVREALDGEVSRVAAVLDHAGNALDGACDVNLELGLITAALGDRREVGHGHPLPEELDRKLRSRYTMKAERTIYDRFFGAAAEAPAESSASTLAEDTSVWI